MASTTPLQALFLLNDPFVHEQSRLVAERVLNHSPDFKTRINFAYELCFARLPAADEVDAARDFLARADKLLSVEQDAWQAYVRTLFRLNEFVYLD